MPSKKSISVSELIDTLTKFTDEYLRGAMSFQAIGNSYDSVTISADHLAYMLRLMVEYGGEESVLEVKLTVDTHLTIEAVFKNTLPELEEMTDIVAAGRKAGFIFDLSGNSMIFRTTITDKSTLSVYALSEKQMLISLYTVFFV